MSSNDSTLVLIGLVLTGLLTFLTSLLGLLFQWWKDGRDRRWLVEDREDRQRIANNAAAQRMALQAQLVETKAISTDGAKKAEAAFNAASDLKAIATDGAEKASAAYDAANSFNDKIKKLQDELTALILEKRVTHTPNVTNVYTTPPPPESKS